MNSEDAALAKLVAQWQNKTLEAEKMTRKSKKFTDIVKSFRKQAKTLVKSSTYLKSISVACIIGFLELSSYYSLLLWLPEIFERFAKFEEHFPNETTSICAVSKQLISLNSTAVRFFFSCFFTLIGSKIYFNIYQKYFYLSILFKFALMYLFLFFVQFFQCKKKLLFQCKINSLFQLNY